MKTAAMLTDYTGEYEVFILDVFKQGCQKPLRMVRTIPGAMVREPPPPERDFERAQRQ